ncbi:MAG: hypothetical protein ACTSWN_01810 [Promethearchaeota archaeon]
MIHLKDRGVNATTDNTCPYQRLKKPRRGDWNEKSRQDQKLIK